jgi:hypothetical protein
MNITTQLKAWLVENCGIKEDATDDEFRKAAGEAMAEGKLTGEKYVELTTEKDDEVDEFGKKLDALTDKIGKLTTLLAEDRKEPEKKEPEAKEPEKKETKEPEAKEPSRFTKMVTEMGGTPLEIEGKGVEVRVKEAAEMYGTTKTALIHPAATKAGKANPRAGQPVMDYSENGRALNTASDRDKAVAGAFAKFMVNMAWKGGSRTLGWQTLPQHDKELVLYAFKEMNFVGASAANTDKSYADIQNRRLKEIEIKQLIDDGIGGASGGVEAVPIVFDDQVIQTPLLHGELFPLVNVVDVPRGRRIEGVVTGTVTTTWGGQDDTAIPEFVTTAYVTAFDTTIFRWEGAILVGLDFLSDTPIDFAAHITAQYGERLLEDLDDVVANGNGTTQPAGVVGGAGTTVAWGGATTIGNYETLRFSVGKNEHRSNVAASAVFCGTETSYQRAKAIPVGAADARRLFGEGGMGTMGYSNYRIMEVPFKINEGGMNNNQIFYAILARYRMYRRRGLTMRSSTEGRTLIRGNELLITATARYGGQLERGAVAGVTVTAPA